MLRTWLRQALFRPLRGLASASRWHLFGPKGPKDVRRLTSFGAFGAKAQVLRTWLRQALFRPLRGLASASRWRLRTKKPQPGASHQASHPLFCQKPRKSGYRFLREFGLFWGKKVSKIVPIFRGRCRFQHFWPSAKNPAPGDLRSPGTPDPTPRFWGPFGAKGYQKGARDGVFGLRPKSLFEILSLVFFGRFGCPFGPLGAKDFWPSAKREPQSGFLVKFGQKG